MIVLADTYSFTTISEQYGQYRLLSWYITGEYKCNSPVNNPFRVDNKPSMSVVDADSPYFIDHALYTSGNWISAAALHHGIIDILDYKGVNIKLTTEQYLDTLDCVIDDIHDGLQEKPYSANTAVTKTKNKIPIEIEPRYWQQYDADYWYPLDIKFLIKENIIPVNRVYMPKRIHKLDNWLSNPTYGYKYEKGLKIYKPLDKNGYKWKSNVANTTLDITHNVDPMSNVKKILCTSKKDRLLVNKITGIPTYSYQCESINPVILPNTIAIIPDNDPVGLKYAERTNLPVWTLKGGKDVFDIAKSNLKSLISQLNFYTNE